MNTDPVDPRSTHVLAEAKAIQATSGTAEGRLAELWAVIDAVGLRSRAEAHLDCMRERTSGGSA